MPPVKSAIDQPLPRIHASSGCDAAYAAMASRYAGQAPGSGQVAAQAVEARGHRVDMGVTEPWRDRPAAELDDSRAGSDPAAERRIGADGGDPPVDDRERLGRAPRRVHRRDPPATKHEVGRPIVKHEASMTAPPATAVVIPSAATHPQRAAGRRSIGP